MCRYPQSALAMQPNQLQQRLEIPCTVDLFQEKCERVIRKLQAQNRSTKATHVVRFDRRADKSLVVVIILAALSKSAFSQAAPPKDEITRETNLALGKIMQSCGHRTFVGPLMYPNFCPQEKVGVSPKSCKQILELKDNSPVIAAETLTLADRANGIAWSGRVGLQYSLSRKRLIADGHWTEWSEWETARPSDDLLIITLKNGVWSEKLGTSLLKIPLTIEAMVEKKPSCSDIENDADHLDESRLYRKDSVPTLSDGFKPGAIQRIGPNVLIDQDRTWSGPMVQFATSLPATLKKAAQARGLQAGNYDYQAESAYIINAAIACVHQQPNEACALVPTLKAAQVPNTSGLKRGLTFTVIPTTGNWKFFKLIRVDIGFQVLPSDAPQLTSVDLTSLGQWFDMFGVQSATLYQTDLKSNVPSHDQVVPNPVGTHASTALAQPARPDGFVPRTSANAAQRTYNGPVSGFGHFMMAVMQSTFSRASIVEHQKEEFTILNSAGICSTLTPAIAANIFPTANPAPPIAGGPAQVNNLKKKYRMCSDLSPAHIDDLFSGKTGEPWHKDDAKVGERQLLFDISSPDQWRNSSTGPGETPELVVQVWATRLDSDPPLPVSTGTGIRSGLWLVMEAEIHP